MSLPSKQSFLEKFVLAILENPDVRNAYFQRFGVVYDNQTPEQIWQQLVDKLSYYGGYEIRRKLIQSVAVRPEDCVLNIGPEMGMECFLLAEAYEKVLVAEPDATTAGVLRQVADYYCTEDGRRASQILDIRRAGIIPPNATWLRTDKHPKPSNVVSYDARDAPDISDTFGFHFADRIVCHHIAALMPAQPQLLVLLSALSSYCKQKGTITWSDEISELSGLAQDYAEHMHYKVKRRKRHYRYGACVGLCPLSEIKKFIAELLPVFTVKFRMLWKTGQLITIAKRVSDFDSSSDQPHAV